MKQNAECKGVLLTSAFESRGCRRFLELPFGLDRESATLGVNDPRRPRVSGELESGARAAASQAPTFGPELRTTEAQEQPCSLGL